MNILPRSGSNVGSSVAGVAVTGTQTVSPTDSQPIWYTMLIGTTSYYSRSFTQTQESMSQNTTPLDSEEELVRVLSRPSIQEMSALYCDWYGDQRRVRADAVEEFLKQHGWTLDEFNNRCHELAR